jgi:hypothetical protein
MQKKIAILGNSNPNFLESSYQRAFEADGHLVKLLDPAAKLQKYIRFGKIGSLIHGFNPIDSWTRKANREIVIEIKQFQPNIILVFCTAPILYGSLAFLKSILTAPIVLVWPDTLFNLSSIVADSKLLFDAVATYSSSSVGVFEKMGFKNVFWLPLAADPLLHPIIRNESNKFDITFIGGWRKEREDILVKIIDHFPQKKIKIFGPSWHKATKTKSILDHYENKILFGKDFSTVVGISKLNLNIIDDTNYPAANMRFFELPICGGLQLSSACPEMEPVYKDKENILYYKNEEDMLQVIQWVFDHESDICNIKDRGHQLTADQHTYRHRVQQLFEKVS